MNTLDVILADVARGLPRIRERRADLERQLSDSPAARPFAASLRGTGLGLIAEVKRRSPSAGAIAPGLDPADHAARYQRAGATAISVLTEPVHFGGSMADLEAVGRSVTLPILRKDFVIDEAQLLEARVAGASAALLIVKALPPQDLMRLADFARAIGLEVLVEVHEAAELAIALDLPAGAVGVNCRNLETFELDKERAWRLLEQIPPERVAVAESGITSAEDALVAARLGADAVLVGGALASLPDPEPLVSRIVSHPRHGR